MTTVTAQPKDMATFLTTWSGIAPDGQIVRTVDLVDLARYAGDWHEIARFPNRFQRRCAGDVMASYAVRPDGRVDVVNRCRGEDGRAVEARGLARVVDPRTSSKLKVRFAPALLSWLPLVWGDYWIVGLADDYSWAVVGSPDRKYLWILARAPALEGEMYERAVASARDNGFPVERLWQRVMPLRGPLPHTDVLRCIRPWPHRRLYTCDTFIYEIWP